MHLHYQLSSKFQCQSVALVHICFQPDRLWYKLNAFIAINSVANFVHSYINFIIMYNFLFKPDRLIKGCTKQYTVPSSTIAVPSSIIQYQAVQYLYKEAYHKEFSFIFESAMEFRSSSVIHILSTKCAL